MIILEFIYNMIGSIILTIWILLGIINIFIWRSNIEEIAEETSWLFNQNFLKKYFIILFMIFSLFFFFWGIKEKVQDYYQIRKVKKLLKKVCKNNDMNFEKEFGQFFNNKPEKN